MSDLMREAHDGVLGHKLERSAVVQAVNHLTAGRCAQLTGATSRSSSSSSTRGVQHSRSSAPALPSRDDPLAISGADRAALNFMASIPAKARNLPPRYPSACSVESFPATHPTRRVPLRCERLRSGARPCSAAPTCRGCRQLGSVPLKDANESVGEGSAPPTHDAGSAFRHGADTPYATRDGRLGRARCVQSWNSTSPTALSLHARRHTGHPSQDQPWDCPGAISRKTH